MPLRRIFALSLGALVLLAVASLALQTQLPGPTGPYAVGRTSARWVDAARLESMTDNPHDNREIAALIWHPAETAERAYAPYFPDLATLGSALVESREVNAVLVSGLRLIRSNSFEKAVVASDKASYPVLLFSPGNAANIEFYAGLAEDLASQGYIVIGLNHPYDVAALRLGDGSVVSYAEDRWPDRSAGPQALTAFVLERIDERVQDALFVVDRLAELNADPSSPLFGRIDRERLGILGHSLGGITAAQACYLDARFDACVNMDGLQGPTPFYPGAKGGAPAQPFMMITKEEVLPGEAIDEFKKVAGGSYRVVVVGSKHSDFSDTPLLIPSVLPINRVDKVIEITRAYLTAFFNNALRAERSALLEAPLSPYANVLVEEYRKAS